MFSRSPESGSFCAACGRDDPKVELHVISDSSDQPPAIRSDNLLGLLSDTDWLRAIRKYRLTKQDVDALRKTWSMGLKQADVGNSHSAAMAFRSLESVMLRKLKRIWRAPPGVKMKPHVDCDCDNSNVSNWLVGGATAAGKGVFVNQLLCKKDRHGKGFAYNRPIVFICMDPMDKAFRETRRVHKKNIIQIDLDKLESTHIPLDILPPGCLIICDDVLSALDRSNPIRQSVLRTLSHAAVRGRHRTGRRGMTKRGIEQITMVHNISKREYAPLRNACKYLTVFPKTNRSQVRHVLKSRLDFTKKQTDRVIDQCTKGGSRWVTFRLHEPMMAIHENGAMLLSEVD